MYTDAWFLVLITQIMFGLSLPYIQFTLAPTHSQLSIYTSMNYEVVPFLKVQD